MSKYIGLAQRIIDADDHAAEFTCSDYDNGIKAALEHLDRNPDRAPGRAITTGALVDAWENAEVVDEYQTGDVMIYMDESGDAVSVFTADSSRIAVDNQRRLSRAPEET